MINKVFDAFASIDEVAATHEVVPKQSFEHNCHTFNFTLDPNYDIKTSAIVRLEVVNNQTGEIDFIGEYDYYTVDDDCISQMVLEVEKVLK